MKVKTVTFSRSYKFPVELLEVKKRPNESIENAAKRLAIEEMQEELRNNFLEPGDEDFTITIK